MLCLLLLFTLRFSFQAFCGCELWITDGHREQMQTRFCTKLKSFTILLESPSYRTETGTCALSLPGLQVSAGEGREGDQARCSCCLAKCWKNCRKFEYISCVLNRKQISHYLCTRKQVLLSPGSNDLLNHWDSQIPKRYRHSVVPHSPAFPIAGLRYVFECISQILFFGTSFSVCGRAGFVY